MDEVISSNIIRYAINNEFNEFKVELNFEQWQKVFHNSLKEKLKEFNIPDFTTISKKMEIALVHSQAILTFKNK